MVIKPTKIEGVKLAPELRLLGVIIEVKDEVGDGVEDGIKKVGPPGTDSVSRVETSVSIEVVDRLWEDTSVVSETEDETNDE